MTARKRTAAQDVLVPKSDISSKTKPRSANGSDLPQLFGIRPILEGEDAAAFDALSKRAYEFFTPANLVEEIYVRSYVDLTWEVERYRRDIAIFINANLYWGLLALLRPLCEYEQAEHLAQGWAAKSSQEVQVVDQILSNAGLSVDHIRAETVSLKINDIERIDHLILLKEARRDSIVREFERFRAAFNQHQAKREQIDTVPLNGRRLLQGTT